MCGIVGYVGKQQAAPLLLDGLCRLEYRGYDSAGVAVLRPEGLKVVKAFTHEEQAKTLFARLNENYRASATAANFYSTAIMPIDVSPITMTFSPTR